MATENGFNVVATAGFIGEHSYSYITKFDIAVNRPDDKDLSIAEKFGQDIGHKIFDGYIVKTEPLGNRPYQEGRVSQLIAVETLDSCIECGKCMDVCPVAAIDLKFKSNPEVCIMCGACGKVCPIGAKISTVDKVLTSAKRLSLLERKEPVTFI